MSSSSDSKPHIFPQFLKATWKGLAGANINYPDEVQKALEKGDMLVRMMEGDDKTAGSLFVPPRATAQADPKVASCVLPLDHYWVRDDLQKHPLGYVKDMENVLSPLELEVANDSGNALTCRWQFIGNRNVQWENSLDPVNGVIIALDNVSPRARKVPQGEFFPLVSNWSDAIFSQYRRASLAYESPHANGPISEVKHDKPVPQVSQIFRHDIANQKTLRLIVAVIRMYLQRADLGEQMDYLTVPANSDEGKILLGSPNGAGVAFFLIQHKLQLGHKKVESVSIYRFRPSGNVGAYHIGLIFHIRDVVVQDENPAANVQVRNTPSCSAQ